MASGLSMNPTFPSANFCCICNKSLSYRFMVSMHAKKSRKGAFHEPQGAAGIRPAEKLCLRDVDSTLSAQSHSFEVHGPNALEPIYRNYEEEIDRTRKN